MSTPVATFPLAPILIRSRSSGSDERVVQGDQPVGERRPDMVLVLQRSGSGAALGAVDHDEVRRDLFLDHRLADRQQFVPVTDAQLESGRLAAGQLAHPGDELHQLARRAEHAMRGRADALLALAGRCGPWRSPRSPWPPAARRRCRAWRPGSTSTTRTSPGPKRPCRGTCPRRSRRPWCGPRSNRCRSPR